MIELWNQYGMFTVMTVAHILMIMIPLLVGVAYLTLAERRVIGAMQLRKGPNVAGPFGLLQPIADAIKLALTDSSSKTSPMEVSPEAYEAYVLGTYLYLQRTPESIIQGTLELQQAVAGL